MQFSITTLALFAALASSAAIPSAEDITQPTINLERRALGGVTFWDGFNFSGATFKGVFALNTCFNLPSGFNNRASSINPDAETTCFIWKARNCQGTSGMVTEVGVKNLRTLPGNFDNSVSSFRCVQGSD